MARTLRQRGSTWDLRVRQDLLLDQSPPLGTGSRSMAAPAPKAVSVAEDFKEAHADEIAETLRGLREDEEAPSTTAEMIENINKMFEV